MKKTTFTVIMSLLSLMAFSQNRNINFETGTFAEIKAKAKKENKLIFIDAYTTWCGPCKWMAANTFTNDTVADLYNTKFINAKIDMEKGEGIEISKHYNVQCYPNLLFVDADGNLIHRTAGALNPKQFIELSETALNPEKQFSNYTKQYESKKTDAAFILNYLKTISGTCLPYNEIVSDYFKTQKNEDLINQNNWNIIRDFSSDFKSPEISYMLSNIDAFKTKYTNDSIDTKLKKIFIQSGYNIIYNKKMKETDYLNYKKELSVIKYLKIDEVLFELDLANFSKQKKWPEYSKLVVEKGDKYLSNINQINGIAWNIFENSKDKNALEKAELLIKTALEKENKDEDWAIYDTYTNLLYKNNKKEEAKKMAQKTIEIAKKEGATEEEYKAMTEILKK